MKLTSLCNCYRADLVCGRSWLRLRLVYTIYFLRSTCHWGAGIQLWTVS